MSDPTQVLIFTLAFMTITFVAGAALYWAITTMRRPPPED